MLHQTTVFAQTVTWVLCTQGNTSLVEVEAPDATRFPLFASATYTETILRPGDTLFIPRKCWHYVRSLSTSISVNFWF